MEELKRKLEGIRAMARSRVQTLKEGETFYNEAEKAWYLQEYEARLHELDRLLGSLPSKPHHP